MVTCFVERVTTRGWILPVAVTLWLTSFQFAGESICRGQSGLELIPEVTVAEPLPQETIQGNTAEAATTTRRQVELDRWNRPFAKISLSVKAEQSDRMPKDYSQSLFSTTDDPNVGRLLEGSSIVHTWDAANIWHQPLYFDDQLLERYGETPLPEIQPLLSAAHFFGTIPMMPYKMAIDRPFDCVSTLGYYRPGSPTPCIGRRIPRDWRGLTWESGAWLGLVFLVP